MTNINCTSCDLANHYRALASNRCPCTSGYFDNSVAVCVVCHSTCLTCTGPLVSNCLTCSLAAFRVKVATTCVCQEHYYDSANTCYSCHHSC